jgi:hypothetical protein
MAIDSGTILVLIALIAVPFAAFSFTRSGEAYRSIGKGALSIDDDLPVPRHFGGAEQTTDPAELRAEVRQLVVSGNERRVRRGLQPLDVEAETERQLADFIGSR